MTEAVGGANAGGGVARPVSQDEQSATMAVNWAQRNKINLKVGNTVIDGKENRADVVGEMKSLQIPLASLNKTLVLLGMQVSRGALKTQNNEINIGDLMKNLADKGFFGIGADKQNIMTASLAEMNLLSPASGQ